MRPSHAAISVGTTRYVQGIDAERSHRMRRQSGIQPVFSHNANFDPPDFHFATSGRRASDNRRGERLSGRLRHRHDTVIGWRAGFDKDAQRECGMRRCPLGSVRRQRPQREPLPNYGPTHRGGQ